MSELTKTGLFCGVFFALGVAIGAYQPVDVLFLEGTSNGVRARIEKRILGLIPLQKNEISPVTKAYLTDSDHDIGFENPSTIAIRSKKSEHVYTHFAWIRPEQEVTRINDYISDPGERGLVTWRPNWPFALIAGFFTLGSLAYFILQVWQTIQNAVF